MDVYCNGVDAFGFLGNSASWNNEDDFFHIVCCSIVVVFVKYKLKK